MFVNPIVPLLALMVAVTPSSEADALRSCTELAALREQTDARATRLAE